MSYDLAVWEGDRPEVVRAFVEFLHGDATLTARFAWRPYAR